MEERRIPAVDAGSFDPAPRDRVGTVADQRAAHRR
jgi:hypothetical protein